MLACVYLLKVGVNQFRIDYGRDVLIVLLPSRDLVHCIPPLFTSRIMFLVFLVNSMYLMLSYQFVDSIL